MNEAFFVVTPATVAACMMGGFIVGRVFFRSIHLPTKYLWNYLVEGWIFFLLMFFVRSFDENAEYAKWLGILLLYTLYIGFVALGNTNFKKGGDMHEEE